MLEKPDMWGKVNDSITYDIHDRQTDTHTHTHIHRNTAMTIRQ